MELPEIGQQVTFILIHMLTVFYARWRFFKFTFKYRVPQQVLVKISSLRQKNRQIEMRSVLLSFHEFFRFLAIFCLIPV